MTHRVNGAVDHTSRRIGRLWRRVTAVNVREAVALTFVGAWLAGAAAVVWDGALSTETRIAATLVTAAGLVALTVGVGSCAACWSNRASSRSRRRTRPFSRRREVCEDPMSKRQPNEGDPI